MVDFNDYNSFICRSQFSYCEDLWQSFTALTEEEEKNWKKYILFRLKKKSKSGKRIFCKETGEVFETIKDLAVIINKTPPTIKNYITTNKSIYGKHYRYL